MSKKSHICVIGSGPAGGTLAWRLHEAGFRVTLLEGSRPVPVTGSDYYKASWPDKVLLYNGVATGLFTSNDPPNEPNFLILPNWDQTNPSERERVYGGTGAHWGGQSRPLDPIVFEKRPAYWKDGPDFPPTPQEFIGWPIDRDDLLGAYGEAAELYRITDDFTTEYWAKQFEKNTGESVEIPALEGFEVEMYQFMSGTWRNPARRTFSGKPLDQWVDVKLNTSVLTIESSGGSVTKLHCASMTDSTPPKLDRRFTVEADAFVLACGAVANARQLLLSEIGNEHDLVGRYFMCHPLSLGRVITTKQRYLTPNQLYFMQGGWLPGDVGIQGRFIPSAAFAKENKTGRCWFWANDSNTTDQYYFEMTPNRDSRITLAESLDPVFGQRQTKIDWQLTGADKHTYETTKEQFKKAVRENKISGEVEADSWDEVYAQLVVNGHHIGTTRMADTPEEGVVDRNLKVHSMDNLYVAGSSVFPTTGISNPTFTIITLSIRLGEHLEEQLP